MSEPSGRRGRAAGAGLSELEACVLGLVWSDGPATAYAVRQVFRASLSPQWSGSAGAIYPLFERMERRRFIHSEPHATGQRRSKRFSITAGGLAALRAWLGPPLPGWAVGVPVDPLRTRLRFLGVLPPRRRALFMTELIEQLQQHLRDVEADCARRRRQGDPYAHAMARGALHMARARRDWVREIASTIGAAPPRRKKRL